LAGAQIDIGRTEGALTFDDPHLAARHARLTLGPAGYVLQDLGTRNGVYHRLRKPVDLEDGDHILIGKQVLQFAIVSEYERSVGVAVDTGAVLFGTPVAPAWGRLTQVTPSGVGSDTLHVSRQEVVLGREQGDIVFSDDEFMSRRHAQLSFRQGRARLEDLGSSNGTFIRLRAAHQLVSGDFIRLGDELLRFDLG
jgi:pSer/pThr/pTyr-binding forkhead associated (FHA) protein